MNATYCLLTLQPDFERLDIICVGALVLDGGGAWHVAIPPAVIAKLNMISGSEPDRLDVLATNLRAVVSECRDMSVARSLLARIGSTVSLHGFEGTFHYETAEDFDRHLRAIISESVLPLAQESAVRVERRRPARAHTRTRLKHHFEKMGILAKSQDEIAEHKVVRNFPVSLRHGLTAEFALQNSVMHITETVDFNVGNESYRTKTFEAQAKCLVLRTSVEQFGKTTQCHVVMSGAAADHASRTVDLLSTAGELYATESAADMKKYLDLMADAAGATRQL